MRNRIVQIALPCLLALLILSPLSPLIVGAFLSAPRHLSGADYASWQSQHVPTVLQVWEIAALAYFSGCWLAYLLVRQAIIRGAAAILWWLSLTCGALLFLFFPIGTLAALPSLIMLIKKGRLYFRSTSRPDN